MMTGKGLLDALATGLTTLVTSLLERFLSPGMREPLLGVLTGADLVVVLCFGTLVFGLNLAAASFLRKRIRQAEADPGSREWRTQLWSSVGRPLHVLILLCGAMLVVTPLLRRLSTGEGPHAVEVLVERLFDVGVFVVLFWLFFRFTHVIEARLKAWAGGTDSRFDDLVVPLLGRSLRVIVPVMGLIFALPLIGLSPESAGVLGKGSSILVIGAVAYILVQSIGLGEKAVLARYDIKAADNLQARKVYTQVHVLSRALYFLTAILTVASVLMLFEEVRRFGTSILASAGVVGIVIGFAAQRTIANLFAGFQLAMTQPIRIDDVVIVEGEWGRIEEITLTYVVVRIWDDRRLIVPLSHFIERPFQNWTRATSSILGSVILWVDYTLPLAELRPAVQAIVEGCADWDRRFWNLQVTEATDRAMQLRVLATAADASKAWNLRCEIRERLLAHVQERYPASLPKMRAVLEPSPVGLGD